MAIICKDCKYEMSKSEIIGHATGELFDFIKDDVLPYLSRKGFADCYLSGWANQRKIPCPSCSHLGNFMVIENELTR